MRYVKLVALLVFLAGVSFAIVHGAKVGASYNAAKGIQKAVPVRYLSEDKNAQKVKKKKAKSYITMREGVTLVRMPKVFNNKDKGLYEIIARLRHATSSDFFIFSSEGNGGHVDVMEKLIYEIKNTKARTLIYVTGPSYSAHAMLTCAFKLKDLRFHKGTFVMFHSIQLTLVGRYDAGKLYGQLKGMLMYYKHYFRKHCKYLTDKEIDRAIYGAEVYIKAEEIQKRIKKHG